MEPRSRLRPGTAARTLVAMNQQPPSHSPGLVRALGPLVATAVVVGTVIGSGVFKKPQEIAENVPFSGLAATACEHDVPDREPPAIAPESPEEARERHARVAERQGRAHIICHRGASEHAHENTLEAYAAALDHVLGARRVAKALLAADQTEDSESRS